MQRQRPGKRFRVILVALLFAAGGAELYAQSARASVDRSTLRIGEQFVLSLEISGGEYKEPNLPALSFAEFRGSGTSQQIQMINGQVSSSKTINYYFIATADGSFAIPPILVEVDGREIETDELLIEVGTSGSSGRQATPGGAIPDDDLFIDVAIDKSDVFVGEPVLLTYRIFTRVDISSYGITKAPSTNGFWVENYPDETRPQTSTAMLSGQRYTVAKIKQMAVFPTGPGEGTVDPLEIEVQIRERRRRGSLLSDFFGDSRLGLGRPVTKRIRSDSVAITARSLPSEGRPASFDGLVGQYTVDASIDKLSVEQNQPLTLTVRLTGTGNITSFAEPKLALPTTVEAYPPDLKERIRRDDSGVSGSKTYEYVLIPREAGTLIIPPIQVAFFDPVQGAYRLAGSNDPIEVEVTPGKTEDAPARLGVTRREIELLEQDIRFVKTEPGTLTATSAGNFGALFWLVLLSPPLGIATTFLWQRHRDRLSGDVAYARTRRARRLAQKRLADAKTAASGAEAYAELSRAVLGFLGDRLNVAEAGLTRDEIRRMLVDRGIGGETVETLLDFLAICDQQRFSPVEVEAAEAKARLVEAEHLLTSLESALGRRS